MNFLTVYHEIRQPQCIAHTAHGNLGFLTCKAGMYQILVIKQWRSFCHSLPLLAKSGRQFATLPSCFCYHPSCFCFIKKSRSAIALTVLTLIDLTIICGVQLVIPVHSRHPIHILSYDAGCSSRGWSQQLASRLQRVTTRAILQGPPKVLPTQPVRTPQVQANQRYLLHPRQLPVHGEIKIKLEKRRTNKINKRYLPPIKVVTTVT